MSDLQPLLAQTDDIYERSRGYRWLALIAALMAWGFDGVEQGVYYIMTRTALNDLVGADGGGDKKVGQLFGLSMAMWLWGAAVGGVVFGRLGDRLGRVRSMLLAVFTYSLFTGLSAVCNHWAEFAACRFLGAIGLGGTWPLCVALVVETWPERLRPVLAGLIGAAANVGFLIAGTYSRIMLHYGAGWRWVVGMGCFIGLASLPIIFMVPEPPKWKRSREKKEKSSLGELFTRQYRRSTIVGSLLSTIALLGTWGSFLWLATYVDKITFGTEYADRGKAIIAQWQSLGQIAGGFLGGVLAAGMGNRKSWILLCVTAWASVFTLWAVTFEFSNVTVILAVLAAFPVTAFFGWLPKFLPELYPTRIRASGQGFSFNIGRILAGIGVLGTGALVAAFGGDYRKGALVMVSIYLLGLIVIWFAPDTKGKMRSDEEDRAATLGH